MAGRDQSGGRTDAVTERIPGVPNRSVVSDAVEATAVSGGVVVGTSALVVLVVGSALGVTFLAAIGFLAGGTLSVAAWLCNRRGPLAAAAGSLTVAVGVLAAAYALSRPFSDPGIPLNAGATVFSFAALLAGLGAVATVPGSLGSGQWWRTVVRAFTTAVLPGVVVAVALAEAVDGGGEVVDAAVESVETGIDAVVFPVGPNANVGGFLVLLALAGFSLAFALRVLPVANLVEKERREPVATATRRTRTWAFRVWVFTLPLGFFLTVLPAEPLHETFEDVGIEALLQAIVDVHALRATIAVLAVVCAVAASITYLVRWVAQLDGRRILGVLATTTPGGVLLVGIATVRPELVLSRLRIGPVDGFVDQAVEFMGAMPLALAVLVGLLLGTTLFLSLVTTAAATGFVPNRTAAPSVAAGGVLLVAVATGIWEGEYALLTFGAAAASLVVWDVGNYGVDVTAELAGTTSRTVELLHVAGSVAVGVGLVALALVALWASRTLAAGGGLDGPGLFGLTLFVVATVVLMSTLRG